MVQQSKAKKMLDYYKQRYLEAAKTYSDEEELRLAVTHEPKVSLNNIMHWSAYLQGARTAFRMMYENYQGKKSEDAVYTDAIFKLIISDLRYTGMFLTQSHEIRFRNHQRDKKGKLVSCEAYFAEKIVIYKEV